jgi:hypothetical protein
MFAKRNLCKEPVMVCRLVVALLVAYLVVAPSIASTPAAKPTRHEGPPEKEGHQRLREGELVELTGKLELSGDRATFHPQEGRQPLRVLENLALERITRVLSESRDDRDWLVSGVVTEYRGANYILIHKAIQRARKDVPQK